MASLPPSEPAAGGRPPSPVSRSGLGDSSDDDSSEDSEQVEAVEEEAFLPVTEDRCILSHLPQEVLSIIASFQYHKDLISLCETCGNLWKAVELFSQAKLEELSHRADDTWAARIADQSLINTKMPGPLEVPHRYRLAKALRLPLYTLGGRSNKRNCICYALHVLPDGESLLSFTNARTGRLWDLSTKQSKVLFDMSDVTSSSANCIDSGKYIIAMVGETLKAFTYNGELVYSGDLPQNVRTTMAGDRNKIFFTYWGDRDSVSCLDLATGNVQENVVTWEGDEPANEFDLLASDGFLVVLRSNAGSWAPNDGPSGIYVFDAENFSCKCFWSGNYHSMAKPVDDSGTIVAARDNSLDVLDIKNGRISLRHSFRRSQDSISIRTNDILLVNQSLAYVKNGDRDNRTIEVYNILKGELVQTFIPSAGTIEAATNGKELFFGHHTGDYSNGDFGAVVRVYPSPMI